MIEKIHIVFRIIFYIFTPDFWRRLLFGQMRINVYLSGGQKVTLTCEKFTVNLSKGSKKYSFDGMREAATFDVSEIIAVKEVRWW